MKTSSDKINKDKNKGLNDIWTEFKTDIPNGINECISPFKMAKTVFKLLWTTSTIQRLIRKRDKAYFQKNGKE